MLNKGIVLLGNVIAESYAFIEDSLLKKYNIPKGGTPYLTPEFEKVLLTEVDFSEENLGGSAINVAKALSIMKYKVAIAGQCGDDSSGKTLIEKLKHWNISTEFLSIKENCSTTKVLVCITPDAQRTMFGIFGATHAPRSKSLDLKKMQDYEILWLEGYQLENPILMNSVYKSVDNAKSIGQKIVFCIVNYFWIEGFKTKALEIYNKANILFGNQEEWSLLFETEDINKIVDTLIKSHLELAVITLGSKGAYIIKDKVATLVPPSEIPNDKVIDTTGAGDYYAAGIIYGYLNNWSIEKTAKLAGILSGEIISQIGTNINKDKLYQKIEPLLK